MKELTGERYSPEMKVFVTGASGFIGSRLRQEMRNSDLAGGFLTNRKQLTDILRYDTIHYASLDNIEKLAEAMQGYKYVVHLVSIINEKGNHTFERINVEGTKNVLAAAKIAGVKRIVYLSAIGADANSPYKYLRSKGQAEEIIASAQGIEWVVIRPSVVLDFDGGISSNILKTVKMLPFFPIPGKGDNKMQPVCAKDVCQMILKSLILPKAANRKWDLVGAKTMTIQEIIAALLASHKLNRRIISVPTVLVKLAAFGMKFVMPNPIVTPAQIDMLKTDNISSSQEAWEILGHKPLTDFFRPQNYILEKRMDKAIQYEDRFETFPVKQIV